MHVHRHLRISSYPRGFALRLIAPVLLIVGLALGAAVSAHSAAVATIANKGLLA